MEYLNKVGLSHLWAQLKAKLSNKVDKVEGKELSTEDFTTVLKNKLESINTNIYEITVDTDWTGSSAPYTKTIAIEGIVDTDIVNLYPVWSETLSVRESEKAEYNKLSVVNTINNGIKLTCDKEVTTKNLNIRVEVIN